MDRKRSHLFVSVQNADGRPDAKVRKTLRSWVTTAQHNHRRERRGQWQAAKPDQRQEETVLDLKWPKSPLQNGFISSVSSSPSSSSEDSVFFQQRSTPPPVSPYAESWTFMPLEPSGKRHPAAGRQVRAHIARRQHRQRRELTNHHLLPIQELDLASPRDTKQDCTSDDDGRSSSFSLLSSRFQDHGDMLNVYAQQLETTALELWSHYLWQERNHGRIFRAQYGQFVGFAPRCLHPLILSNPTMLASTVLFTGCHMRYLRRETIMTPALLRIRSLAYHYVQAAVDSEKEQLSDATLLAVVKLALFEMIFGQRTTYQVHMEGIVQMVRLRKGLANLGMGGYVAHLLVWFDANLSAVAKIPRYLTREASLAELKDVDADTESFVLGVE